MKSSANKFFRRGTSVVGSKKQRGVILLLALIILVVMTLSGIALIRSVDTANVIAGNLSFRQGTLQGAESGIEAARAWLIANRNALNNSNTAQGYYAVDQAVDYTGNNPSANRGVIDWKGDSGPVRARVLAEDTRTKNTVAYIIHRLCTQTGPVNEPGQSCASETGTSGGSTQGALEYPGNPLSSKENIYYRVTLRVAGPKNTNSFVQAMLVN